MGRDLDVTVAKGVDPDRFSDEEAEQLEALVGRERQPTAVRAALAEHRRAREHAARLAAARAHAPVVTLPFAFTAIGPALYADFAKRLL